MNVPLVRGAGAGQAPGELDEGPVEGGGIATQFEDVRQPVQETLFNGAMAEPSSRQDYMASAEKLAKVTPSLDKLRRKFAKLLVTLDHSVGHVVDTFKDNGLWDNTILIMSSDNGACNLGGGTHLRFQPLILLCEVRYHLAQELLVQLGALEPIGGGMCAVEAFFLWHVKIKTRVRRS